jgi:hypothetical protein
MSFFDPFLDAFSDIGDSVSDFAESDEGKLAMLIAAAYLTGGTSLGAEGTAVAGEGAASAGAFDVAGFEGLAQSQGLAPFVPEAAGITAASTIPTVPTISPVGAPPGITSLPPTPTNAELLTNTGWTNPQAPLDTSGVTKIVQGAGPVSEGTQLAQATGQDAFRQQIANDAVRTTLPSTPYETTSIDRAAMNSNVGFQGSELPMPTVGSAPTTNPFLEGASQFGNYIKEGAGSLYDLAEQYPKTAIAGTYLGANALGLLKPKEPAPAEKYNGVLTRYKMSPDFQASNAQPNVYKPTYAADGGIMQAGGPVEQMSMNAIGGNTGYPQAGLPHSAGYASPTASPIPQNVVQGDAGDVGINPQTGQERFVQGGIAHFSRGNLASAMDFYKTMTESQGKAPAGPAVDHGPGIYYDQDPDTRYQDALTAAQIRQAKVNKRANVSPPVAKRPTPMGQLNLRPPGAQAAAAGSTLDPENAAQGGIMHSSLGGYAAGGNPRLLKGPGDGMSDNIPATIAGKQPARLADGEFVIPADVVSHLGNGSTDAGAKRLHEMMNKIRKARTGNSKQGKQINPNKYMPA